MNTTMRKVMLIPGITLMLLGACNTREVRITGNIRGLEGTVRLLAELPEKKGFSVLTQQDVRQGEIDLRTEQLVLPAQVWIDFQGKKLLEVIVDSRKETFIEGEVDSLENIAVTGSRLMTDYKRVKQTINNKFNLDTEGHGEKILEISQKEEMTRDDEVKLGLLQASRQRLIGRRADYVKLLVSKNPTQDLSLFLLKNELADSLAACKKLFSTLAIPNKESNIYKILELQLQ